MAVSYNWVINPLECYPTASNETDVVFIAHWQLHANEEVNGVTYSATSIGTQAIPIHSGSAFIPFNDLTLDIVQGWVEEGMGAEQVQAQKDGLAQIIADKINPPVVTLQSPWMIQPTPEPTPQPSPEPTPSV